MEPRIENLPETKLVGKRLKMSFAENQTRELWQSLMPRRNEIKNVVGAEFYSVEIYPKGFFDNFSLTTEFEKWAAVKVTDFENFSDFENLTIPAGLYVVFIYKGKASEATPFYQNIFTEWLPKSAYKLDNRPHFAVMGEKYKNDDVNSEEEIWIPVEPAKL